MRVTHRGFTIVELLAVVGFVGVTGSVVSVGLDDGTTVQRTPSEPPTADERIESIRRKLADMKQQIHGIEEELKEIQLERLQATPGALAKARATARQLKDATHVRGIHQSFVVWAQANKGAYPLPSKVDEKGTTVAGAAESKDTTANIFSILIFNGYIPPELCVSPAEAQANITVANDYSFDTPKTAVKPADAMWDPAFSADFTNGKKGNVSYAHLQPAGPRLKKWSDTFNATEAVVANRGPEIASTTRNADGTVDVKTKIGDSITYLIHGDRDKWDGNIAWNDGHVTFESGFFGNAPKAWVTYTNKEGKPTADVLFYDESDSKEAGDNHFLGIFTASGKAMENWTAIWD